VAPLYLIESFYDTGLIYRAYECYFLLYAGISIITNENHLHLEVNCHIINSLDKLNIWRG